MARQLRGSRIPAGNMKRAAWWYYYMGGSGGGGAVTTDLVWDDTPITLEGEDTQAGSVTSGHNITYTPKMWYHDGKTYFSFYEDPTQSGGKGQGYVIVYDPTKGVGRPFRITSTLPSSDSHVTPAMIVNDDGIYMFQERVHGSPIDIYKGADFNYFEYLSEKIGPSNLLGYMNIMLDEDGNGITWCRWATDPNRNGAVVRASNGLESWGTPRRLTTNVANDTGHYNSVPYYRQKVGEYWYVMIVKRVDELVFFSGWWWKYWMFKTTDFIVFENVTGTPFSHDTTGNNYMTETILQNNFQVFDAGTEGNNAYTPQWTIGPSGEIFMIIGDGTSSDLYLHIIIDRVHTTKTLNISNYTTTDPALRQTSNIVHIMYNGSYIEVAIGITGANNKVHLFRSTDLGDTWEDVGDMIPEITGINVGGMIMPFNYHDIPENQNFVMAFLALDETSPFRKLFFKRAAKGTIQSETITGFDAVAIPSDAYNILHYIAQESSITHTGTNLTAITDLFGVRNGTGVNNPQWDGTEILFNGTNNYINVTVASLALSKLTVIAVVRSVGGANNLIISFTDNTSTTRFLALAGSSFLAPETIVSANVAFANGSPTLLELGQDTTNDDEYHIYTFVIDGRSKVDIYIDGKKQWYKNQLYVALSDYEKRGKLTWGTAINSIRIASRDSSGTDVFRAIGLKEIMCKNNVYDYETQRGFEKTIADRHGITLTYEYQ